MWLIKAEDADRYYEGCTFSRLYDDYRPQWSECQDTSNAEKFDSKEAAEGELRFIDPLGYKGYKVVELI